LLWSWSHGCFVCFYLLFILVAALGLVLVALLFLSCHFSGCCYVALVSGSVAPLCDVRRLCCLCVDVDFV
jgi:hypothetical protein